MIDQAVLERPDDTGESPVELPSSTSLSPRLTRLVSWSTAHYLTLAAGAVVLLVANRNQWFFGDEWAFIAGRGPGLLDMELFRPHNEHWSTLPLIAYWALLSVVGLKSYLPYIALLIVLHLVLAHLLWRACLRVGARPAIATIVVGVFVVLGAGAENLLWAFQIGFVGSIMFGWAAVLLHDHDGPFGRRDVAGWVASIAALMCSSPAIAMVGIATLTVWLRRRNPLATVLTAAVPAAAFALWWLLEGHEARSPDLGTTSRWAFVDWAWTGLTQATESIVGIPQTGGVLVLALLFWWARHLDLASGPRSLAFAGTVGAVGFYLMTGWPRVLLGLQTAGASRYAYIAAALLLPGVVLILSRTLPDTHAATGFVAAMCAMVAFHNVWLLREETSRQMEQEHLLKDVVLTTHEWDHPIMRYNPDLRPEALPRFESYDWLP